MTGPTIPEVVAWRTEPLEAAAERLGDAASVVEQQALAVRRSLGDVLHAAGGAWAEAADDRAGSEARTGLALADAMAAAAAVATRGAADLSRSRTLLARAVDDARVDGFEVGPDGSVTAPDAPAPLAAMGTALEATAHERAREAERRRAGHESQVRGALAAVATIDAEVADSLARISFPETVGSALAAHRARTALLGDPVAALGTAGGVVAGAVAARDSSRLVRKGALLRRFLELSRQPGGAGSPASAEALRAFSHGTATHPVLKASGRLFLPTTLVSGSVDLAGGGGYDGARGWATRGFALAGAGGAGVLMAAAVPGLALSPVGIGVAGAAVLGYGAWTTGNYVVDHWEQVEDASGAAVTWAGQRAGDAAGEVADAVDWAHEQLAEVLS